MIDRKKGPKIVTDFDLSLHNVKYTKLDNGLELYEVNEGTQDIIKIELVFNTGRIHEQQRATAKAAVSLLREGSTRHSSEELAKIFDFYGAVVKTTCTMEYCSVSLVVVERYLSEVWPIWHHMVFYPLFKEQELNKYKTRSSQKLTEQLSSNDVQSYRKITEIIFGSDHPYGYNTEPADILQVQRKDVVAFYNQNFGLDDSLVILSGKYTSETRALINKDLMALTRTSTHPTPKFYDHPAVPETVKISTSNKVQTSIKVGRTLFPINHPDFTKVRLLDLIFGGYFGSRLMKNIREEKGYTYGIYSAVHCWKEGGFHYISADVDNTYIEPTLLEIEKEMRLLREELVPDEELTMVKSYILGQSLHLLDGPFAKGELVKNLKVKGRTFSDFDQSIKTIKRTSAEEIRDLAQRYLDRNVYTVVLAGGET